MPSTREIRRRIRSVRSISQITKAMQMVAASKMRRAQERALASRPYAEKIWQVLSDLSRNVSGMGQVNLLLQKRPVQRVGLLLITPDRGMSGSLNANIIRKSIEFVLARKEPVSIIAVGRRGRDYMLRTGHKVVAEFTTLPEALTLNDVRPIARVVADDYVAGRVDEVHIMYTEFVNTLMQRPVVRQLLPVAPAPGEGRAGAYIYEPSPEEILSQLVSRFVEGEIYQALLDAFASEQSARMVAMRNATENANELLDNLVLTYNRERQSTITGEILEVVTSAEALGDE